MSNYLYSSLSLKISEKGLLIRGSLVQAHPEAPKKVSCRSTTYGIFLFYTFQNCSQLCFVVANSCFSFAELTIQDPAKNNNCEPLSSSNVDKLKIIRVFQLSTTFFDDFLQNNSCYAERLHRAIVPLHPKSNGSMGERSIPAHC